MIKLKWVIYALCLVAIVGIVVFLNYISKGNPAGIGLGDFIIKIFGYICISNALRKGIWRDK